MSMESSTSAGEQRSSHRFSACGAWFRIDVFSLLQCDAGPGSASTLVGRRALALMNDGGTN